MRQNGSEKPNLKQADRNLQAEAGVKCIVLHGCNKVLGNGDHCQHVYVSQDKRDTCPKCGHRRYKINSNQPNEKVYWFPLQPRLKALLKLPNYRRLLQVPEP